MPPHTHTHKHVFKAIPAKKPKTKIADKGGGRCGKERAAIGRAASGRPRGLALRKFMVCKRGGSKKHK